MKTPCCWLDCMLIESVVIGLCRTKRYEITDSDMRVSLECIDNLMDAAARGKSNIPPEAIPWRAMRELLITSVYGM